MKKVLHLITGLEFGGGAENALLQIIPELKKTENRICCIKGRGEIAKKLEQKGIKIYYLNMKNWLDFSIIFKYKKVIKEYKPDIQVNYLIHADIFGRVFGKLFGVKKIVSFNRSRYKKFFHKFIDKITFGLVDFFIANSEVNLSYYRKKNKIPEEKSFCIPNGVDLKKYSFKLDDEKKLKELKLSKKDFILTCVARLSKEKDHEAMFKALKYLNDKRIKLILCGEGKEKEKLKKLRKKLGLEDQILILGNRKDVLEILRVTDVFVLPSLFEGMSNALLEAMASKKCCLVSDIDENKELIKNGKNGLTFKVKDCKDLARKIKYMMENKEKREEFGKNAFKTIKEKYEIHKIIKEYDELLEKV